MKNQRGDSEIGFIEVIIILCIIAGLFFGVGPCADCMGVNQSNAPFKVENNQ